VRGPEGYKLHSFNQLEGKFCNRTTISDTKERLDFYFMPPSFTCVIKVKSRSFVKEAIANLNSVENDRRLKTMFDSTP
jgi:hypothetical protein